MTTIITTTTTKTIAMPTTRSQQQGPSAPAAATVCNIFHPLSNDLDKIFCRIDTTTDETATIPWNSAASAMLNIFAYPKPDLSSQKSTWKTIQRWMGLSTSTPSTASSSGPPSSSKTGKHRSAAIRRYHVAAAEDFADISTVVRAIRQLSGQQQNPKPYLVLINPKAGPKRNAEKIFDQLVQPMLEQAGIDAVKRVTNYPRHAEEIVRDEPNLLSDYGAIIAMGGDGIIHEILQGLKDRWSKQSKNNSSSSSSSIRDAFKDIKLGVIGCGTSNGLAKSLTHASEEMHSQLESTFLICKGRLSWMDLSLYNTIHNAYTSFLTFSWAFVADVDIESERIHFLGAARFDLWAIWRIISLRRYRAKFSYLPPPTTTLTALELPLPPLEQPLTSNSTSSSSSWVTTEDDFIVFWASQATHAAEATFQAPQCQVQDGLFNIFIIRGGVSRLRLLLVLLGVGDGSHVGMPGVEFVQCVAYRLEAMTPGSFNNLDGEVCEPGPIQGQVLPAALQVFCNVRSTKAFLPPTGTSA